METQELQTTVTEFVSKVIGDNLLGVYLYGSAVTSGLKTDSDLDFLLVTQTGLTDEQKKQLIEGFLELSGAIDNPEKKRYLDITSVALDSIQAMSNPITIDFAYGEWLREDFVSDYQPALILPALIKEADYTLALYQALNENQLLAGEETLENLLPEIAFAEFKQAAQQLAAAFQNDYADDVRNVLLTLSRMLVTLRTEVIVPKDFAGVEVAQLQETTPTAKAVLLDAVVSYAEDKPFDISEASLKHTVDLLVQLVLAE